MVMPLILAVIAAVFYAMTNHIDKYMVSKVSKNADYRALVLISTGIAGIAMTIIYLFVCNFQLAFDWQSILILFGNSILYAITLIFWFKAIGREDATVVVIMFQLIPVFSLLLSPILLRDQTISLVQLIGGIIITLAAIFITYEPDKKKFSKKKLGTLALMTATSLGYTIWFILERYVNQNHDFNQTTLWSNITLSIVGILIFIFIKSYRKSFRTLMKHNALQVLSLNLFNEFFNSFGGVISTYAGTMTSIALVSFITQGVQPFAVMILGILLAKIFPKIHKEKPSKKEFTKRIIAIIICIVGLAFIEFG